MRRFTEQKTGFSYLHGGTLDASNGIIFVPGWACQAIDYEPVLSLLEPNKDVGKKLQLIALDLPGHGQTDPAVQPNPTITTCALSILKLAGSLGLQQCILAGHSMGCRVVLETWNQSVLAPNPAITITGLVLIDASHYKFRPSFFSFDKADPRSATLTQEQIAAKKAEAFEAMFSDRTPPAFRSACLRHMESLDLSCSDSLRLSQIAYDSDMLDDVLDKLGHEGSHVGLLNLQSSDVDANNQRVPLEEGQRTRWMNFLQAQVPHAAQHIVTGARHFPHVDQQETVSQRIRDFVGMMDSYSSMKP